MSILLGLGLVLAIIAITYVGVEVLGLTTLFGIVLPYVAVACFIVGFVWRIVKWAESPGCLSVFRLLAASSSP